MKKFSIIMFLMVFLITTTYANDENEKDRKYIYYIQGYTEEDIDDCWIGWKRFHYGGTTVTAKKGDEILYPAPPIIEKHADGSVVYREGTPTIKFTNGYGYYSFDYNKNLLGLLSYMKKKVGHSVPDYPTKYTPTADSTFVDYTLNSNNTVNLKDALSIAINGLIVNRSLSSYENGEFSKFWTGTFIKEREEKLRNVQNQFYWEAYGANAFKTLTEMMDKYGNKYYDNLDPDKKKVLQGMVLSIMEARYRNKNLQNRMDLKVKASEGDLWPFLVNLSNLNHLSYDKERNKYIDDRYDDTYYEFPDFDRIVDGVYQWMVYYDSDTLRTTTHRTISSHINENSDEDYEVEIEWKDEFSSLTHMDFERLTDRELQIFYDKCQKVRSLFKKSKENTEGIFGAEELYDITSDKNFSIAIRDMKEAMLTFAREVGGDIYDIWSGLKEENLGRTYIMAKNIVEANKVRNEYAYYDIGTNIITYTYGRQGKEYILMDFQKIELEEPLKGKDDKWTNKDTDGDGILDRNELGDDSDSDDESRMWKDVDITMFIRKAVEKELYGNDTDTINSVEGKKTVDIALSQVKYNIYNDRKTFNEEHKDDNMCSRREYKENYLNIDSKTEVKIENKTEAESINIIKNTDSKLTVRLWKYKSNPVLKDTDFDGIDDSKDKSPKNNHFEGRLNSSQISGADAIEVDMNMDYRYFFLSNKLYYDELSTMSLLYANSIYRQDSGVKIYSDNNPSSKNLKVKDMMEFYGFENIKTYYMGSNTDEGYEVGDICRGYKDTHKGRVALGYRNIEYHGLEKTVIGIVIRGTAEDDDWDSDFDMGDVELRNNLENIDSRHKNYERSYRSISTQLDKGILDKYDKKYSTELLHFAGGYPDWKNTNHHAGFDIVSNRILEVLNDYMKFNGFIDDNNKIKSEYKNKICFWVTGHSMGGGVANLVAANLIDRGYKDNVYCYTFASPNTFYLNDNTKTNYTEPHGVRYRCIFNIVNEDDFVPALPMEQCNWTKYGRVAKVSFNDSFKNSFNKLDISLSFGSTYGTMVQVKGNKNLYKFGNSYHGKSGNPIAITEAFTKIFENKNDMRSESYNKETTITCSKEYNVNFDKTLFRYTLPFQRNKFISSYRVDKNSVVMNPHNKKEPGVYYVYEQTMTPQYLFSNLAEMMHEYSDYPEGTDNKRKKVDNKLRFFISIDLPMEYYIARKSFASLIPFNLRALYIKDPHFLECYYALTKIIDTVDFE